VEGAQVTLFDDEGNQELYVETEPGTYRTTGLIHGEIGHSYYIRLETSGGDIFQSGPERISPVGQIDSIYFNFEERNVETNYGETNADVFNIYVDADAGPAENNYVRLKFTGWYQVDTQPEFHTTWVVPYTPYKDPPPCSGYIVDLGPIGSGGALVKVGDCTCCTCWITQHETLPQVMDRQLISGSTFRNVKVGEVPINNLSLKGKYLVYVEQMSLSKTSFDFFELIREQKENPSDIFQTIPAGIQGNIKGVNTEKKALGMFWATARTDKKVFIFPTDVPYLIPPADPLFDACTFYDNSSTEMPSQWE
jgi:hypothetical protein